MGSEDNKEGFVPESRFNKVYGQMKQTQREMEELKNLNKELSDSMKMLSADVKESKTHSFKNKIKDAVERGDTDEVMAFLDKINKGPEKPEASTNTPDSPKITDPELAINRALFKRENAAFFKDPDLSVFLKGQDLDMAQDPEWRSKLDSGDSAEYFKELGNRVAKFKERLGSISGESDDLPPSDDIKEKTKKEELIKKLKEKHPQASDKVIKRLLENYSEYLDI